MPRITIEYDRNENVFDQEVQNGWIKLKTSAGTHFDIDIEEAEQGAIRVRLVDSQYGDCIAIIPEVSNSVLIKAVPFRQ